MSCAWRLPAPSTTGSTASAGTGGTSRFGTPRGSSGLVRKSDSTLAALTATTRYSASTVSEPDTSCVNTAGPLVGAAIGTAVTSSHQRRGSSVRLASQIAPRAGASSPAASSAVRIVCAWDAVGAWPASPGAITPVATSCSLARSVVSSAKNTRYDACPADGVQLSVARARPVASGRAV